MQVYYLWLIFWYCAI